MVVAEAAVELVAVEVADELTVVRVEVAATGPPTVIARSAGFGSASRPDWSTAPVGVTSS